MNNSFFDTVQSSSSVEPLSESVAMHSCRIDVKEETRVLHNDNTIGDKRKGNPDIKVEDIGHCEISQSIPKRLKSETNDNESQNEFCGNDLDQENCDDHDNEYQHLTPSDKQANRLPFSGLCKRLEQVWKQRQRREASKESKLSYLFPSKKYFQKEPNSSMFQYLRIILPDIDYSRPHNGMKEKTIAETWGHAMGLDKRSRPFEKLVKFTDPSVASAGTVGDLSLVVEEVMKERMCSNDGSSVTLGKIK
mmetsp:Transcript_21073/g.25834  ORF Transcript_21073/g.25834 Transcript_21073/m.25834 type:complete len:249 (+) Transcript_21073:184-930(+)